MRPHRLPRLFWLGTAVYLVLTLLVATHALDGLDRAVLRYATAHHRSGLGAAADHLTNLFSPANDLGILAVGAGGLAWLRRRPHLFVIAALTAGAMAAIVLTSKAALGRPLPHTASGGHADAFPSGHTATFLVCFGTLALLTTTRRPDLRPRLLARVGVATLVVAASLVYDGFHWLSDTVGSMALGVAVLSALSVLLRSRRA